jgi:hypothetical protein
MNSEKVSARDVKKINRSRLNERFGKQEMDLLQRFSIFIDGVIVFLDPSYRMSDMENGSDDSAGGVVFCAVLLFCVLCN